MASVTSQKQWEDVLRDKSLILNFDPTKRSTKEPPRSTKFVDLSPRGIQRLLADYTDPSLNDKGDPIGLIPYKRLLLHELLQQWEVFKGSQVAADPKLKPQGAFAEKINKLRAEIEVYSAECRKLHELLKNHEQTNPPQKPNKFQVRVSARSGKFKNGRLAVWAGRAVVQNDAGEDVFADDGSPVREFIQAMKIADKEAKHVVLKKRKKIAR
jgi:hypothetical protein